MDTKTIEILLQDDPQGFELMNQRPKIVISHTKDELVEQLQKLLEVNKGLVFPQDLIDQALCASSIPSFRALGITNLLVI